MPAEGERAPPTALVFAVHVFTASGAALGLLALIGAVASNWTLMFAALGAALFVDGIDGSIARALKVSERLPRWSGETLDLVVDFVNYVFVPAYAIVVGGWLWDAAGTQRRSDLAQRQQRKQCSHSCLSAGTTSATK